MREVRSVLMFHGIGAPVGELERGEEDLWIDWSLFDSIVDYCATLPPQDDRFTFDDGNASDLEAARRMRARGITGYFFVLVGRIGNPGYLTADDLRELERLGMQVGLHGRDHRDLRKVNDATLVSEVDLASQQLTAICDGKIDTFAIPYGAYNRRVWTYLKRTHFTRIYTSDRGVSPAGSRFVRRNPVMRWHSVDDVSAMLHDVVAPQARLRRTVAPLIKRSI